MVAMSTPNYKYRVTNTSDETQFMDDNGLQRRFKPGQSQKTESKPDGRKTWYEIENLHPEVSDIENTADIEENSEASKESEEDSDDD